MTTQTKQSNETYVGAPAGGEPGFSRALRRAAARHAVFLAVSVALLAGIVAASLFSGSGEVAAGRAWQVLWSPDDSAASIIVHDLRVPRTVLGLVVGMALGVAGALLPAVTRNPLADPGILGVNAGASFAVTLGIAFRGIEAVSSYVWLAMAGAAIASVMVFGIAAGGGKGATPLRLTLVGMAFGSVLLGANRAIGLLDSSIYEQVRFWEAGSVADRPPETLTSVLPFIVAGLVIALLCARPLNALALGEDSATSLGARVGLVRGVSLLAIMLLCGGAVAAAGPIAFIGLMIPHVVRWIIGPDQRWIIVYTMLLAPVLLIGSDVLGRFLVSGELPVGIVTAFVGAPILIILVRRERASGL